MIRHTGIVALVLLTSASYAADIQSTPAPDTETIYRKPSIRTIPRAPRTYRFAPQTDLTTQELEQLTPYLKGKPLLAEDEQALGAAMRHLRVVN